MLINIKSTVLQVRDSLGLGTSSNCSRAERPASMGRLQFIFARNSILFVVIHMLLKYGHAQTMTFGRCQSNADCFESLECRDFLSSDQTQGCDSDGVYCVCFPPSLDGIFCRMQEDCNDNETCLSPPLEITRKFSLAEGLQVCLDNSQVPYIEDPKICEDDEQCGSNGVCINVFSTSVCLDGRPSSTSEENLLPSSTTEKDISPSTASSDGDSAACIAMQHLDGMPLHMLTYNPHLKAAVLCDAQKSCATGGHMVRFHGRAMMMQSYCELVGCVEALMFVNNPRYIRNAQLPSQTDGLTFTTLAARYNSVIEENLLRAAVYVGL